MATMEFVSTCKFCGQGNLAWVHATVAGVLKWVLYDTEKNKHSCTSTAKKKSLEKVEEMKKKSLEKVEEMKKPKKSNSKVKFKPKGILKKSKKPKKLPSKLTNKFKEVLDDEASNQLHKSKSIKGTKITKNDFSKALSKAMDQGAQDNPLVDTKKVQLKNATKLYQAVSASSKGSTYYVVAMFEGLNVAARIKVYAGKYTVSIRIEGSNLSKWKNRDMLSKFVHGGDYASVHFDTTSIIDTNAIIYAFIGMIPKPCLTPMPVLSKLLK